MPDSPAKKLRTPKRFRSIQGVRRFVAVVLTRLDDKDNPLETDRARVMIYGAKVLAELIEGSDLEKRIAELERRSGERGQSSVQ